MTPPDKSNSPRPGETARQYATRLLVVLVDQPGVQITQGVAVELANHFAHLAGGDGFVGLLSGVP